MRTIDAFVAKAFDGQLDRITSTRWRKVKRGRRIVLDRMKKTASSVPEWMVYHVNKAVSDRKSCVAQARLNGRRER